LISEFNLLFDGTGQVTHWPFELDNV
jgi:hypothetical protein